MICGRFRESNQIWLTILFVHNVWWWCPQTLILEPMESWDSEPWCDVGCNFVLEIMKFEIFDGFLKSEVSLRNRDLEAFLRSKCIEKYLFGKLRVRAFHRLKNQRLRTSPSKVTTISNCDETHKMVRKYIQVRRRGGRYATERCILCYFSFIAIFFCVIADFV